ncbi:MAG: type IV pilus secretin PilQ [Gammaproteobacteria bacterium]
MIVTCYLDNVFGLSELRLRRRETWLGWLACVLMAFTTLPAAAWAADSSPNTLESMSYATLPGNRVQVTLTMAKKAAKPLSFTIDKPARIALDFPATDTKLAKRYQPINVGVTKSVTAVAAQGRTRVVLDLVQMVPYRTRVDGNKVIVTIQDATAAAAEAVSAQEGTSVSGGAAAGQASIDGVTFHRGEDGQGKVVVKLSDPSIPVDMNRQGNKVVVNFFNASLPKNLERRLDVSDFATPVQTVDTYVKGNNVRMVITPTGDFEQLAYQTDNTFTVEVKPVTKAQQQAAAKKKFKYTGQKLSLNFQDIDVRSVLQLLADFTGINIVVSDSVKGKLTLRLKNVPWDQALDIILSSKGLAKRQVGNVMWIAPSEEMAAREKLELQSKKQIQELAPLESSFIQINYAKAQNIASLIKSKGKNGSLLSERGTVSVDPRTNTLLVQDTADKIEEIRKLVARLDIPVRQVLISSRIVIANNDFARNLGVKLGLSGQATFAGNTTGVLAGGLPGDLKVSPITGIENPGGSGKESLMVDLPVSGPTSAIDLLVGRIGHNLLRLELNAMQAENRGQIISSPRVITSNQKEAVIESGVEIPYQQATSSGATSVSFKKATLSLKVTPQITPDDRIIMDLKVHKDSVGQVFQGVPSVDTRAVDTQVLVDNGETVVLGGIYEQTQSHQADKVPFFGDLPGIGYLFKRTQKVDNNQELLVFVTPKIVKQNLQLQ